MVVLSFKSVALDSFGTRFIDTVRKQNKQEIWEGEINYRGKTFDVKWTQTVEES